MIVIRSQRHVSHRPGGALRGEHWRQRSPGSAAGGRRHTATQSLLAGRQRKGGVGGVEKRPAVAGHGEGDMRSQQKG